MLKGICKILWISVVALFVFGLHIKYVFPKVDIPNFHIAINQGIINSQAILGSFGETNDNKNNIVNHVSSTISYDFSALPTKVQQLRLNIIKAAKSGEIEALRPLLGVGANQTQLLLTDEDSDPIEYLKQLSGDGEGVQILAIIIDLLNTGYVHLDQGTKQEVYVWPYLVAVPLDELTKAQMVESYQIMTTSDFDAMKELDTYSFFRIGITADGQWQFFISGD